jgi:hypothetical protein
LGHPHRHRRLSLLALNQILRILRGLRATNPLQRFNGPQLTVSAQNAMDSFFSSEKSSEQ